MTYPPPEPPPTDPPLPPQQPYVPGQYLPGYDTAPGAAPEIYGNGGAYGYSTGPELYGYGPPQPIYPYGYGPPRETEGLAIASLVVSCAAVLGLCSWGIGGVLGIVGAILGHVARRHIRDNGRNGDGMALAGIIVGWAMTAVCAVLAVVLIVVVTHDFSGTRST